VIGHEVNIQFQEVPTVRTLQELRTAAGHLATSHYACVLELDETTRGLHSGESTTTDLTLEALKRVLAEQHPNVHWTCDPPLPLEGPPEVDDGLHVDAMVAGIISIGCHQTNRGKGGLEVIFASPTTEFQLTHRDYLR
jgi:hypothetical protein